MLSGLPRRLRRGRVHRQRTDTDGNLHPIEAETIATNKVVRTCSIEKDEILAGAPVPGDAGERAVVVAGLVHLEDVVHVLHVPECWD